MEFDPRLCLNADQLEQSVSRQRARLGEIADDEQRSRRAEAMDQISAYVGMLREAEMRQTPAGSFSFRLEHGWSQRRLARVGYTAAYISRLEAGERQPSIRVLRKLADELGVDPHYLETGHEDPLLDALREIADGSAKDPQRRAARALKLH